MRRLLERLAGIGPGRVPSPGGLPTPLAAFLAVGSSLFFGFVWYLLTWRLPIAAGRADLAARWNPFAPARGVGEIGPLFGDPVYWAALVLSNVLIMALPLVLVRLLHRGSPARLVVAAWAMLLGLNLLYQSHHLSPAYSAAHRLAFAADLVGGLLAAAAGARLGTALRRRAA